MDFNSIEEIISKFKIISNDEDEIKKELKLLIKTIHPDKNKGNFKDSETENLFHDVQAAITFIESHSNQSLTIRNEITSLTKAVNELVVVRKGQTASQEIEQKDSTLTTKLQDSVRSFHKRHATPKISSAAIATIMTAVWMFPNVIKNHPLLSFLSYYYKDFTIAWIGALIVTAFIWAKTKAAERLDETIKKTYRMETTQNQIFSLFIKWLKVRPKKQDINDEPLIAKFSKDDMMDFLTTRYQSLNTHLDRTSHYHHHSGDRLMEEIYRFEERKTSQRMPFFVSYIPTFLSTPGEIDIEIAQLISDLTVERLLNKGVVKKITSKSLSDLYEFEVSERS